VVDAFSSDALAAAASRFYSSFSKSSFAAASSASLTFAPSRRRIDRKSRHALTVCKRLRIAANASHCAAIPARTARILTGLGIFGIDPSPPCSGSTRPENCPKHAPCAKEAARETSLRRGSREAGGCGDEDDDVPSPSVHGMLFYRSCYCCIHCCPARCIALRPPSLVHASATMRACAMRPRTVGGLGLISSSSRLRDGSY